MVSRWPSHVSTQAEKIQDHRGADFIVEMTDVILRKRFEYFVADVACAWAFLVIQGADGRRHFSSNLVVVWPSGTATVKILELISQRFCEHLPVGPGDMLWIEDTCHDAGDNGIGFENEVSCIYWQTDCGFLKRQSRGVSLWCIWSLGSREESDFQHQEDIQVLRQGSRRGLHGERNDVSWSSDWAQEGSNDIGGSSLGVWDVWTMEVGEAVRKVGKPFSRKLGQRKSRTIIKTCSVIAAAIYTAEFGARTFWLLIFSDGKASGAVGAYVANTIKELSPSFLRLGQDEAFS